MVLKERDSLDASLASAKLLKYLNCSLHTAGCLRITPSVLLTPFYNADPLSVIRKQMRWGFFIYCISEVTSAL